VRLLFEAGHLREEALTHFADFVQFSLALDDLDGRSLVSAPAWRDKVIPDFQKYVRPDEELTTVRGSAVTADTRVNPNGTIDISRWARPQHDGPPLRVLSVLKWMRKHKVTADASKLLQRDLEFTAQHWRDPSFDIWEEESGHHYYTLRVAAAALNDGGEFLRSDALRAEAQVIYRMLDGFWRESGGCDMCRRLAARPKLSASATATK